MSVWWLFFRSPGRDLELRTPAPPVLTTDRPEDDATVGPYNDVPERGALTQPPAAPAEPPPSAEKFDALVAAGRQALERGELVQARTLLSEALRLGEGQADVSRIKAELVRLASETIFSLRLLPDDPLVERYVVKPGDSLAKIARAHKVSADLLAEVNQIPDKNLIRAGQTIKIIKGPFLAVVRKSDYALEVYLGDILVRHFKVGLGAEGSTPGGEWRVSTKLVNPTYYPPRGGQIVAADDPDNPLGERWIGLEGVSGEALGQLRYGIHGTIEPESIGGNVSLGCIRLYNEDVEALYTYLIEKESSVVVRD